MPDPLGVPDDFGGLVGFWMGSKVTLLRYGHGQVREAITFTPLNLLQAIKTLQQLADEGERLGHVTPEHKAQSKELPSAWSRGRVVEGVMPRDDVDKIAGPD